MWDDTFNRRKKLVKEYFEIIEIIASGRSKISEKDINSELMSLWDAGLITDKNGKYKNGKSVDENDSPKPKDRRTIKVTE